MAESPVQIVIVCHVEAGTVRDRTIVFDRRREEGITQALPRIVEFADGEHIPVTIALTPQSLRTSLVDLAGQPLGLHLHPQDPVLEAHIGKRFDCDCLAHHPFAAQSVLIRSGVDIFTQVTGRPPTVFVAGNWSENNDTLRILETAGFLFDASPLPGFASPCANWSRLTRLAQPYRPSRANYQVVGDSTVLYIPVFRGYWGDYLSPENLHYLGVRYFKAALVEAAMGHAKVVHIYFHSPAAVDPFFLSEFRKVLDFARDEVRARFASPEAIAVDAMDSPRPFPPAYLAYLDFATAKSLFVRKFPRFTWRQRSPPGRA